ncbi:MAG TPA: hypothetical protein PK358_12040 [Spirochaetota bacterium]|nr:hypothetical protein [Spirochaetota bacterium]HPJ35561.1 hypothetical protein [Spirochaetota bacterium]
MGIFNATATYGKTLRPTDNPDEYYIKIYTGGFAGADTAEKRAIKEIEIFLNDHQEYNTFKIINSKFNMIPSYHKFTVLLEK